MTLCYTVPKERDGVKIQNVLRRDLGLSATMIRRLKTVSGIFVDGNPVYTNYILSHGEEISVDITAAEPECDIVPQDGELHVIYEDDGILAANKPAGIITHPSRAQYMDSLSNYVSGYLQKRCSDGRCHSVNRLDRGTSGVVLFAKNSYMMDKCAKALKDGSAFKEYTAVVYGHMNGISGTIDLPIYRPDPRDIKRITDPKGQRAITHYFVEKLGYINSLPVSVLRLRLETGRTHQIRVHCCAVGHPLLGDNMYFDSQSESLSRFLGLSSQLLHAHKLSFTHPLASKPILITAPIVRSDMLLALDSIE